ncbi:6-hydroxymethyl-7,8-dihydropterin pyrophosphokinase [uncultured archaeon]|nr:6-hydroxymethyl-7,8-dihydropterin pyrophosphokinase [uncultured archaeon]
MRFEAWEPLYLEILDVFGFSRERDEDAGILLFDLLKSGRNSVKILAMASELVRCRFAVICGNAPTLAGELEEILHAQNSCIFVAADGATSVLLKEGVVPEIIVTDLDGCMDDILRANDMGSIMVVHAHGDNQDLLREYVPKLRNVVGTTQTFPPNGLYNFGGFTDGDRCVFFARYLGVSEIKLIGFDFDDMSVTPRKHKKLAWAKRLIELAIFDKDSQRSGPECDS